jgi:hypothetical protein
MGGGWCMGGGAWDGSALGGLEDGYGGCGDC